jgi:hypothetical protein
VNVSHGSSFVHVVPQVEPVQELCEASVQLFAFVAHESSPVHPELPVQPEAPPPFAVHLVPCVQPLPAVQFGPSVHCGSPVQPSPFVHSGPFVHPVPCVQPLPPVQLSPSLFVQYFPFVQSGPCVQPDWAVHVVAPVQPGALVQLFFDVHPVCVVHTALSVHPVTAVHSSATDVQACCSVQLIDFVSIAATTDRSAPKATRACRLFGLDRSLDSANVPALRPVVLRSVMLCVSSRSGTFGSARFGSFANTVALSAATAADPTSTTTKASPSNFEFLIDDLLLPGLAMSKPITRPTGGARAR